jgi:SAM-dependent methyltransferase
MVEIARRRSEGLANVSLQAADAQATGLPAASFDGVVARFVLMLTPEPPAALAEAHRLLRPGGRIAFAVWASAPENPWGSTVGRSMIDLGLAEPPEPDAPGPFRLGDANRVLALVTSAGFDEPTVDDVPIVMRYASFDEYWEVTQDLAMSLRNALAAISDAQAGELRTLVAERFEPFAGESGLALPGLARVVSARRPS